MQHAYAMYLKNKAKQKPAQEAAGSTTDRSGQAKKQDADKIAEVYQYIYEVEERRIERKVLKVESLFDTNPLEFEDSTVRNRLERQRKEKQMAYLNKSHQQIYEEEMERN